MPARVTLRDLAEATGFHFTTVGLALRGDRRVQAGTAAKVKAAAARLGYRPDPMLSALSAYRHNRRVFRGTLGYLFPASFRTMMDRNDGYRITYEAAVDYADTQGLKIEPIDAMAPGLTPARLTQLLEARGIRGLILAPLFEPGEYPALPWERFSVVAIGYSVLQPVFHRACVHQARSMRILLRELRELGYRRIGFLINHNADVRTGHNFLGAYLADQEVQSEHLRVRPLVSLGSLPANGELRRWLRAQKPDCIVGTGPEHLQQLEGLGLRFPADMGFAMTGIRPRFPHIAGMDERWEAIGQAMIDLLFALVKNRETGVPAYPRFALVEGRWTPGPTVRASETSRQPIGPTRSAAPTRRAREPSAARKEFTDSRR